MISDVSISEYRFDAFCQFVEAFFNHLLHYIPNLIFRLAQEINPDAIEWIGPFVLENQCMSEFYLCTHAVDLTFDESVKLEFVRKKIAELGFCSFESITVVEGGEFAGAFGPNCLYLGRNFLQLEESELTFLLAHEMKHFDERVDYGPSRPLYYAALMLNCLFLIIFPPMVILIELIHFTAQNYLNRSVEHQVDKLAAEWVGFDGGISFFGKRLGVGTEHYYENRLYSSYHGTSHPPDVERYDRLVRMAQESESASAFSKSDERSQAQ